MKRQLVIGASGQLGIELIIGLQDRYGVDAVVATDIRQGNDEQANRSEFMLLDATNEAAVRQVISEGSFETVYHLVAMLSAKGENDPLAAWDLNMKSLLNILECAREGMVDKVFWPSSIAVFGPDAKKDGTPQDTFCDPTTIYGVSKVSGELWANYYNKKYGVDIRSIRYPGLIGHRSMPGGGTTDYAVDAFYKAIDGVEFECYLEEGEVLPMMHMDDAVRATLDLMEAPSENISVRTAYNLSGCSFSPSELNDAIAEIKPGFKTVYNPDARQNIAASWPNSIDDSRARVDWGWEPKYDTKGLVSAMLEALSCTAH
jgi:nucleoside-diphosphate-sugar epimerase